MKLTTNTNTHIMHYWLVSSVKLCGYFQLHLWFTPHPQKLHFTFLSMKNSPPCGFTNMLIQNSIQYQRKSLTFWEIHQFTFSQSVRWEIQCYSHICLVNNRDGHFKQKCYLIVAGNYFPKLCWCGMVARRCGGELYLLCSRENSRRP